jgi:hypothetical protein
VALGDLDATRIKPLAAKVRATYPFARITTATHARVDSRLSYGFVAGPGVHETSVTRPDLFRSYLIEQIELLLDNHNVPVEVGESDEATEKMVANAVGAAIAQVSGEVDRVVNLDAITREEAIRRCRSEAITRAEQAGARTGSAEIVDQEEVPLAYLPSNATRIRVKAVGDAAL